MSELSAIQSKKTMGTIMDCPERPQIIARRYGCSRHQSANYQDSCPFLSILYAIGSSGIGGSVWRRRDKGGMETRVSVGCPCARLLGMVEMSFGLERAWRGLGEAGPGLAVLVRSGLYMHARRWLYRRILIDKGRGYGKASDIYTPYTHRRHAP